ncbi:hypothetical protein ACFX2A_042866 [Malus domestica]
MESFEKKFLWPPCSFNTASGCRWRYSDPCSLITVLGPHNVPLTDDALALARFRSVFIFIRIRRNHGVPAVDYLTPSPSSFIRAWDRQCKINLHRQSLAFRLRRGVDIVIGTPSRIQDHIERSNIDSSTVKVRILDEADEMLWMGFVDDIELILVQTLLFSATLPSWLKGISFRFLKPDKKTVDLVGNEKMKASTNVGHIVLSCSSSARLQLIPDIIDCYSRPHNHFHRDKGSCFWTC